MTNFSRTWTAAAPALFVLLWSTGFIGAGLGLPHAEPFVFLAIRFSILAFLLAAVSALIVGIQPLLTAVAAGPYLGEKVSARQWSGLLLGFAGGRHRVLFPVR